MVLDDVRLQDNKRAARTNGLTGGAWTAEAEVAAAISQPLPEIGVARAALLEMLEARTKVRRVGINVNQAAKILNASGKSRVD